MTTARMQQKRKLYELKRLVDWRARDILKFMEVQEKAARRTPNKMPPTGCRDYAGYQAARRAERLAEWQRYGEAIGRVMWEVPEDPEVMRVIEGEILKAGFKAMGRRRRDLKGLDCVEEAAAADIVLMYAREDESQNGALIEVGAALAAGKRVFLVSPHNWS